MEYGDTTVTVAVESLIEPPAWYSVDLCTGAGAIAAAMAAARPRARVVGTELDPIAARCTRRNHVEVFEGSLDERLPAALEGTVDVMTAVVPYVPTDALRLLPRDVQAFEPRLALDGGPDGTDLLAEVVRRAPRWLRPGGWLLLELGGDQAEPVGRLSEEHGFTDIDGTRPDVWRYNEAVEGGNRDARPSDYR